SVPERRLRHMSSISEHDIALDRGKTRCKLFHQWHKGEVEQHDPIFGVVDDPGDLVRKEPGVDGVIDRSDAEDSIPALRVTPAVPWQGRDPVGELDAVLGEPLGHPEGTRPDVLIVGRVYWSLDRA